MPDTQDVLILGAGFSGLCLARLLQLEQPGLRVTLLERRDGPAPRKVGESTVEIGAHFLHSRLKLDGLLRATQLPKNGLRFWFGAADGSTPAREADEDGPITFSYWQSYQIERDVLEADLRATVVAGGASLITGVRGLAIERGDPHVVGWDGGQAQARWLVDATGLARVLGCAGEREARLPHSACWGWFAGARPIDARGRRETIGCRMLSTNHVMGAGYWIWLIPLASGALSVGVVYDETVLADAPVDRATFRAFVERHAICADALAGAELVDFGRLPRYAVRPGRFFGDDRTAAIGFAAGFGDPLYSGGSDLIGMQCEALAELITDDDDRRRAAYEAVLTAFYDQVGAWFAGAYATFDSFAISVARYRRDLHLYWNLWVWPYVSGQLRDPDFIDAFAPLATRARRRTERFVKLMRSAHARRPPAGPSGEFAFNQLGQRLVPQITFERQLGTPLDLAAAAVRNDEIDRLTLLALLDIVFDGDRCALRGLLFDALSSDRLERLLQREPDDAFWDAALAELSDGVTERLAADDTPLPALQIDARTLGRLRAEIANQAPDDATRKAITARYVAGPVLSDPGPPADRDALQPRGPWGLTHTPWPVQDLDWRTVYELYWPHQD